MSDAATSLSDRPTPAADVFSLAAIMYRFVAGREMLSVGDDTVSYWAKVCPDN